MVVDRRVSGGLPPRPLRVRAVRSSAERRGSPGVIERLTPLVPRLNAGLMPLAHSELVFLLPHAAAAVVVASHDHRHRHRFRVPEHPDFEQTLNLVAVLDAGRRGNPRDSAPTWSSRA